MRTKKTGSDRELSIMQSFSNTLKQLPPDSRNRIVAWVSAQDWADEKLQPAADPRQTTIPALS